ncbi:MAG: hypothetical protein LBD47_12740 [Treponema sp.]|jgi:hypothetical protein|nr:hypothetical protein [Treponema sp.]
MKKGGVPTYYHSALAGTTVKPGSSSVLPVMAEMNGNEEWDRSRIAGLWRGNGG